MRIRVGIVDVIVAAIVLWVIAVPDRTVHVRSAYAGEASAAIRDVARYQALLAARPGDGEVADALAQALLDLGQSDWAIRVAAAAGAHGTETAWRAHLAVSAAHARRLEIHEALTYAERALEACEAPGALCPDHWHVRLSLYHEQLERGVASGIDPTTNPDRFRRESTRMFPPVRTPPTP
jgi:hypothetical protein